MRPTGIAGGVNLPLKSGGRDGGSGYPDNAGAKSVPEPWAASAALEGDVASLHYNPSAARRPSPIALIARWAEGADILTYLVVPQFVDVITDGTARQHLIGWDLDDAG